MAYATLAQVQSQFKRITFSASSAVTTDDVAQFIEDADAVIDAEIGCRYTVPVTGGTSALALLRKICITLVAQQIREIMATKTPDQKTTSEQGPTLTFDAYGMLEKIKTGQLNLIGAEQSASGIQSFTNTEDVEPFFDAESEQW